MMNVSELATQLMAMPPGVHFVDTDSQGKICEALGKAGATQWQDRDFTGSVFFCDKISDVDLAYIKRGLFLANPRPLCVLCFAYSRYGCRVERRGRRYTLFSSAADQHTDPDIDKIDHALRIERAKMQEVNQRIEMLEQLHFELAPKPAAKNPRNEDIWGESC